MIGKKVVAVVIFVVTVGIVGLLWTSMPLSSKRPQDPNWVVLITMDTVRSDHLGCYGYNRNTSPNIDKLASSGVMFTNCYTTMPTTDPSHVSILTSTYPRTHGVIRNGMKISNQDILCLAEIFKEKGYSTAAITARSALSPRILGLGGFEYDSSPLIRSPFLGTSIRNAKQISSEAIRIFRRHLKDNLFIWIHYFDPHGPYKPPPPYTSMFNDGSRSFMKSPMPFSRAAAELTDEDIAHLTSLYDGEIRYMDFHIGKLMKWLENASEKYSIQPFIILTADHGETLGELKEEFSYAFDHGEFLYENAVKIPLILSYKDKIPQGRIVDALVESIDISPTMIGILFGEEVAEFSGISFNKSIFSESADHKKYAYLHRRSFETPFFLEFLPNLIDHGYAITSQKHKLIENPISGPELYDLTKDEFEDNNLAKESKGIVDNLSTQLLKWKEEHPLSTTDLTISKEKQEILESLGYLP